MQMGIGTRTLPETMALWYSVETAHDEKELGRAQTE